MVQNKVAPFLWTTVHRRNVTNNNRGMFETTRIRQNYTEQQI